MTRWLFLLVSLLLGFSVLSSPASANNCGEVLVDGTKQVSQYRYGMFFQQILAAEYTRKSSAEIARDLAASGGFGYGGFSLTGSNDEKDFQRYIDEIGSKLNISTIVKNESSILLASGDKEILKRWAECVRNGGFTARFEVYDVDDAALILEWHTYPVKKGVDTSTALTEDITIPKGINVTSGDSCRKKGTVFEFGKTCTITVTLPNGATDWLVSVNVEHGSAQAYLPKRQVLQPEEETWAPRPGTNEVAMVGVYSYDTSTDSPTVCADPKSGWAFLLSTVQATPWYRTGRSDPSGCKAIVDPKLHNHVCWRSSMRVTAASDNSCYATLHGKLIRWNVVDGMAHTPSGEVLTSAKAQAVVIPEPVVIK
ncbi:hypothetical protein [Agrobacterium tumefaciens]|uniref:hypothetical protein n=1 Tax=Agrobacterium tumefaciens TaxID=358 RepID=UPI003CE56D51